MGFWVGQPLFWYQQMTQYPTADNIDLDDELVLHKNGRAKNIICTLYLILWPYCLQKLSKLVDKCRGYSKPKQAEKTQFPGFMFPQVVKRHQLGEVG